MTPDGDPRVWIVNGVIAFVVVEAMLLAAHHRATGRGLPLTDVAGFLSSGLGLLLAARSVLVAQPWQTTASWLAAAGCAHAFDLWRRWPRTAPSVPPKAPPGLPLAEVRQKGKTT